VTNEKGHPLPGVKLLDTKTNEVTTTDASGGFTIPELDGYLTTAFAGYDSMTVAISPRLDIKLQESSKQLSQRHKRLVDMMDDEQLILYYRNEINSLCSKNWPICSPFQNNTGFTSSSVSISLVVNEDGRFEVSHYYTQLPERCKEKILGILEQAEYKLFEKDRPVSFNLRINL